MSQVLFFPLRLPDDTDMLDAARLARANGMHLIHKGDGDVRVSPICPPGWFKVGVSVKPAPRRVDDVQVAA